jgi:hypothetical protein
MDNVLLEEIRKWVELRGFQLTDIDQEAPPTKRIDTGTEGGGGRNGGEPVNSDQGPPRLLPSQGPPPRLPPPSTLRCRKRCRRTTNHTPTPIRTYNTALMDIEKSSVQKLQSGMEELHKRKEDANQTVAASIHAPADQMAISPKPIPAMVAAESVISTCPLPTRTSPPDDPMLLAIMAALNRIQSSVDLLDKRVKAVEKPTTCTKPTPAAASAVSMPAKPSTSKHTNPTIDLKAKVSTPRLPKPTTLVPETPRRRPRRLQ